MNSLDTKVKEIIRELDKEHLKQNDLGHIDSVNDRYNSMVERGFIEKKGYNLLTVDKAHLVKYTKANLKGIYDL